jgi:two-component system nitrate/nitrite response regulator NarL
MPSTAEQVTLSTIRLVLVDDHAMFRSGVCSLSEKQPDMQIVGEAGDGETAIKLTMKLKPDVLLLDLALPRYPGLQVLKELKERQSRTKTILLTASIDRKQMIEAIQLGARGIVLKEATTDLLFKAIRSVVAGEYWVDRGRVTDLAQTLYALMHRPEAEMKSRFGMTPREQQIVAAVLSGYSNKDIARKLSISDQTVKNHLTSIFDKIGVSSRLELALCATKHQLDDPYI